MKFLIDAQLPPALARWLVDQDFESVHVFDIGMSAASDVNIANLAEADAYVLISKDEDFLHLRRPDRFGLIWLRCGNTTTRALLQWMAPRWPKIIALLQSGEMMVEVR